MNYEKFEKRFFFWLRVLEVFGAAFILAIFVVSLIFIDAFMKGQL